MGKSFCCCPGRRKVISSQTAEGFLLTPKGQGHTVGCRAALGFAAGSSGVTLPVLAGCGSLATYSNFKSQFPPVRNENNNMNLVEFPSV